MPSSRGFTDANVPDQSGKCFIVTGANTGLGFEISRVLAARGARVLLACRDQAKAESAMAQIKKETPRANLAFLPLDQADLVSIQKTAEQAAKEPRIDALINNAGVMMTPLMRTKQGFELQFGVNHVGCFALTSLLLPKLAETKGSRVVVTSSVVHRSGKLNWDDLNWEKSYDKSKSYSASKLANALFFTELDRRLRAAGSPLIAVGCHPGVARTELFRHFPAPARFLMPVIGLFVNSPAQGAWPALQAATGQVVRGKYYGPTGFREIRGVSGEAALAPQAQDADSARRLWDVSVEMTRVDPNLKAA